jgi:hypothetical protein
MPYYDLHKKSGVVPKQNQIPSDEKTLQNYDAMFGNKEWRTIVMALDTDAMRKGQEALHTNIPLSNEALTAGNLELELMNCYKKSLLSIDPELTVKSIGLHFPDRERTIYHLVLTTHDPTGALTMNKVLSEAEYQEYDLRWELTRLKKWEFQLTLIAPELQATQRTSIEEIAVHIRRLFKGKTTTRKGIYNALEDEPYFPEEVNKALTALKRQKLASFGQDQGINTRIKIT